MNKNKNHLEELTLQIFKHKTVFVTFLEPFLYQGLWDVRYKTIFSLWQHPKPSLQSFLSSVPDVIVRHIQTLILRESSIIGMRRD